LEKNELCNREKSNLVFSLNKTKYPVDKSKKGIQKMPFLCYYFSMGNCIFWVGIARLF